MSLRQTRREGKRWYRQRDSCERIRYWKVEEGERHCGCKETELKQEERREKGEWKSQMKWNEEEKRKQHRRLDNKERQRGGGLCFWFNQNVFLIFLHESPEWPLNRLLHEVHLVSWTHRIHNDTGSEETAHLGGTWLRLIRGITPACVREIIELMNTFNTLNKCSLSVMFAL